MIGLAGGLVLTTLVRVVVLLVVAVDLMGVGVAVGLMGAGRVVMVGGLVIWGLVPVDGC